jgi:hypothetical protein
MSPSNTPAQAPGRQPAAEMLGRDVALDALREALRPSDILTALQAIGLDSKDLAEGIGADERTVRRWLHRQDPTRNHQQTIGALRVLAIHILQRRGLPVDLVARWLRLPDSELRFQTPLAAIAKGQLNDVIVAFDEYVAPRPGTALRDLSDSETDSDGSASESGEQLQARDDSTGEFAAVPAK